MRLTDVDLMRLLPQFTRDDRNAQAFAYAIQSEIIKVSMAVEHSRIYTRIDSLTDEILDELAWQFNIAEYRTDYDISVKRNLIKGCMVLHYRRGTVSAVEKVVKTIFGEDSNLEEWFDYGGRPYHFKVRTSNIKATDEMIQDLTRIVKETQNVRSHLEAVIIETIQSMNLHVGCKVIIMDDVSLQTAERD